MGCGSAAAAAMSFHRNPKVWSPPAATDPEVKGLSVHVSRVWLVCGRQDRKEAKREEK